MPHCPSWVYSTVEEGSDRIYLGGSYLNYPNKHDRPGEVLEMEMFPEWDGERQEGLSRNTPSLSELSIDDQERVLLDEIIGAMMGQEGQFVRYRLPVEEEEIECRIVLKYNRS